MTCTPAPSRPAPGTFRILYVDDHPADVALMRDFAEGLGGIALHVAATPDEAAALASEAPPSLVILDVGEGSEGPRGVLERIRAIPSLGPVPIIALSASAHPRQRVGARYHGVTRFLTKPLDLDALAVAIDRARPVEARPQRAANDAE